MEESNGKEETTSVPVLSSSSPKGRESVVEGWNQIRSCAEQEDLSQRELACESSVQLLSDPPSEGESHTQILLNALDVAKAVLSKPEIPNSVLHLSDTVLRGAFDIQGGALKCEDPGLWSKFVDLINHLLGVLDSASVTFQCSAARMLVDALLLYTSSASNKLGLPAKQIAERVQAILKVLLAWLRPNRTATQASCLTIAAVNCFALFVSQRPGQVGRILPSLISLANSIAKSRNFSAASIQKVLKRALLGLWKAEASALLAWKGKIKDALMNLGIDVETPAEKAAKAKQQAASVARRSSSRLKEKAQTQTAEKPQDPDQGIASSNDPQVQRGEPSGEQRPAATNVTNAPAQQPLPDKRPSEAQPPAGRPDPANSAIPGPPPPKTRQEDLMHTVSVMANLLAQNNLSPCLELAYGLPAPFLADLVMSMMDNLPRREDIVTGPNQGTQKSGIALLAGLMQATAAPAKQNSEGPPSLTGQTEAAQPAPKPPPPATPQAEAAAQSQSSTSVPKVPKKAPVVSQPPPPPPEVKLVAVPMDDQQRTLMQAAALKRISSCKGTSIHDLRSGLISHLIPQLQAGTWPEHMMTDMMEHWDESAYELMLKWLYAVFVATRVTSNPDEPHDVPMEPAEDHAPSESINLQPSEQYTECLRQTLTLLRTKLPAKDRSLAKLLVDAPALPAELLTDCLSQLLDSESDYATLALIAARDVIIHRPANRKEALAAILGMAVCQDPDLRAKAVRLVANKLFPETFLTSEVHAFALSELRNLKTLVPPTPIPPPADSAAGVKRPRVEENQDPSGAGSVKSEPVLNSAASAEVKKEGEAPPAKRVKTESGDVTVAPGTPEAAATGASEPAGGGEQPVTSETAARHCELYCALCTKRHALLPDLFACFGQCKAIGRAAIMRNAEGLARVLGPEAPALLALVAQRPSGSTPLLLRMLNFLTESQLPPQVLVQACQKNYAKTSEPGIMAPVLGGLPQPEVIKLLPKLLAPIALFNAAMHQILRSPSGQSVMSPEELLLALHSLDHTKEGITLRQIMTALDHCLTWREKFDRAVLLSVLQKLSQRPVIPPLYMRFLMQAQAAVPLLKSVVLQQLGALVNKQIWMNKSLFLGWNLAVRQNVPESFPAFLQLPARILSDTLKSSPDEFKKQLQDWAESPSCPANQKAPIQRLFDSAK